MKRRSARIKGIATSTLLLLFMLGATVQVVSSAIPHTVSPMAYSATHASNEESQSQNGTASQNQVGANDTSTIDQVGANETATATESTTEEQLVTNETSGANNQVGENQTEGDNVNVIQIDQGEQNQIAQAQANDTIAGEVQVNETAASATTTDSRFTIATSLTASGGLDIIVTGHDVSGPKSFLVALSSAQDPTTHTLLVTLDGARVPQASGVDLVLHPHPNSGAYVVVKSASGYQLLVSIPHFSAHTLSIVPLAPGPAQGFFSISWIWLAGAAIALTAAFAFAYATRKRAYTLGA